MNIALSQADLQRARNPFVPISIGYRMLLIGYVVIYEVLTPGLSLFIHGTDAPLAGLRYAAGALEQLVLFAPLFFYRSSFGWLHPILYPTLFVLGRRLIMAPETLLSPFAVFSSPLSMEVTHIALRGWSQEALAAAELEAQLLFILATLCYYAGFFVFPSFRVPNLQFPTPSKVGLKSAIIVAGAALAFLGYMQAQGGLTSHMQSWRYGRSIALSGDGPIHVLINVGTIGTLIWYAMSETALRSPAFWAAAAFTVPVNFFVSGSRSAVVLTSATFLLIWMIRHQKVPQGRVLVLGLAGFITIGSLGAIRSSVYTGDVDWTVLTDFDPQAMLQRAQLEASDRATNAGFLPVIARVPEEVPLLKGQTYLSVVFFWFPRAFWPAKPQDAAFLNGRENYGYTSGTAVPTGPVAEAYWNFHIPGVVVLFVVYGMFHCWLAGVLRRYHQTPAAWLLYVFTLVYFIPYDVMAIVYLQAIIPTVAILLWMNAIQLRKRRRTVMVLAPAAA